MTYPKYCRECIRTTNEKRWVQAWREESHPIKVRSKRNLVRLPDDRDDLLPSCLIARSWKRYRKTQWKPKLYSGFSV